MPNAEERLRHVQERIEAACRRCGRSPHEVTLIGVSKTVSWAKMRPFCEAGLRDFGENYGQEALAKMAEMAADVESSTRSPNLAVLRWHFVGALQSNKARDIVGRFVLIHSVDRQSLARAIQKEAQSQSIVQEILLQVNLGDEAGKAGCSAHELPEFARFCSEMPNLKVRGLMCLPPAQDEAEKARVYFRQLRQLRDEMTKSSTRNALQSAQNGSLSGEISYELSAYELSMGMTNDFEVAIEEGATLVRVGTGLFGARD